MTPPSFTLTLTLLKMLRVILRSPGDGSGGYPGVVSRDSFQAHLPPSLPPLRFCDINTRVFKTAASGGHGHPGVVPQLPRQTDPGQAEGGGVLASQAPGGEDAAVLEQNQVRAAEATVGR